ncbi:MAG: hypothetical protein FJX75_25960 [Armatimonadetes bacterium]|nr:hypothetical protein [Armatimonadota bacterium]
MKTRVFWGIVLSLIVCSMAFGADLPLKQVVLFSSGVGYFHRQGEVDGNAQVELTFRTEQIPDLLKSLVLQDFGGGTIAPVTYAPQEPIERTLGSFAVDISDNPSLFDLLNRLRGVTAEIKSDHVHTGVIMGVETQQKSVGDQILEFAVINLLTDGGIVEIPIWQVKSLQITDAAVSSDLRKALGVLAQSRDVSKRPVTLGFKGNGRRSVSAGYLLETPVWKTSYRLVLADKGLQVQGWAIVENTTDDDWTNVGLTLVSGRPISFIQDLYEPLYLSRPVIPPSVAAIPRPKVYDKALDEYAAETEAAPAEENALVRRGRPAAKAAPGLAGGMGGGLGRGMAAPAAPPAAAMLGVVAGEALGQAMAAGEKVGELFQYAIDQPVTIGRQKSAMIPIVNAKAEGEKVSVFNAGTDPKHPYNGVKLKNTTGLHLMGGPVTVFDGGIYAGDALIEDVAPDDERLLTYAVDLDVEVEQQQKGGAQEILSLKIIRGVLILTRKNHRESLYTARNAAGAKKALLIEHPFAEDWKLLEPEKPEERARSVYRFRVELAPQGKGELKVVEEQPVSEMVALTDADADQMALFVRMDKVSDAVKQALQKLIQMKAELADTQRQIAEREGRLKEITDEQERIRKNMEQLSRDSELYKRYVDKLTEQETEYESLQGEIKQLKAKETEQLKAVQDYIAGLNVE